MTTYNRICVRDYEVTDKEGNKARVCRGKEYCTSKSDEDGNVVVFTQFWFKVPVCYFAGEVLFTP